MNIGVPAGSYKKPTAAVQECVGFYPEKSEQRARGKVILRQTPGLDLVTTLSGGRGLFEFNDVLYAVTDNELVRIDSGGNAVSIGTLPAGRVSIAANLTQMIFVFGGTVSFLDSYFVLTGMAITEGYTYSTGSGLQPITDADFPTGDLLDSIYLSELDDGRTWIATEFGTAEGSPDKIRGHIISHREAIFLGTKSMEYFRNTGNIDFPLERSEGTFQERGCAAERSIAGLDNSVFFLGNDRIVYKLLEYRPQRVSDHAIEQALEDATLDEITSAIGFAYTQSGHYFYNLTVGNMTYVYDSTISNQLQAPVWHKRSASTDTETAYPVQFYANAYGAHYGLTEDGALYQMKTDVYTDADLPVKRLVTVGPMAVDSRNVSCRRLTLVCETGTTADLTETPAVTLTVSRDGGRTWGEPKTRSLGMTGQYSLATTWRRLGTAPGKNGFTFRFQTQYAGRLTLIDVDGEFGVAP